MFLYFKVFCFLFLFGENLRGRLFSMFGVFGVELAMGVFLWLWRPFQFTFGFTLEPSKGQTLSNLARDSKTRTAVQKKY